jgi:tetrahydromethanopterin S-methyltransferase subunit G
MTETESEKLARMVASGFNEVHERFNSVDARFDLVDRRFDTIDKRFDSVDARLDGHDRRFDSIESRLADLELGQRRGFKELGEKFDSVIANHGERITALERRRGGGRRP